MGSGNHLQVAIKIGVSSGASGGIFQSTVGLVYALGKLDDGPEEYVLVVKTQEHADWLRPYSGPNQRIVVQQSRRFRNWRRLSVTGALKFALATFLPLARYVQHLLSIPRQWPEVPVSDGFLGKPRL